MVVEEYLNSKGDSPFKKWFETLDSQTALKVNTVLIRMKHGNNSNVKGVGSGVFERTVDHGPGYRIYFGKEGHDKAILLSGGSKKGQQKDIDRAKLFWKEYKIRKHIEEKTDGANERF